MRVLMMGGTQFVGRTFTEEFLKAGWEVTHFNRGKTNPDLFPGVNTIVGDRNEDLSAIASQEWDVVVDVNAYLPHQTKRLNEALKDSVRRFVFVSTISVYADGEQSRLPESAALQELKEDTGVVDNETYGAYKVICENLVNERWGDKATILRPGVIIGPWDHTERFPYWPIRFADGGKILLPQASGMTITALDVRDFAEFTRLVIDRNVPGVFNCDRATAVWDDLLAGLRAFATQKSIDFEEVTAPLDWLGEHDLIPWRNFPSLLPVGASTGDCTAAIAVGLKERTMLETIRDTYDWTQSVGLKRPLKSGIGVEQEEEAIKEWLAR
ncbi:MAG: NAD-dependent epimerase/dehydratase family protein [Fimbriimonadaceae bacterium]|nr:MAG: NAD-dependent epimerase/dehydratase family protein [Fimbriimonadaceae bacterium]